MEQVVSVLNSLMGLFDMELSLFGFSFSFWQLFVAGVLASVLGMILRAALS